MQRLIVMCLLAMGLAACFRDASENRNAPTTNPIGEFLSTETATPRSTSQIPTLTSTPEQDPTNTLAPGGQPTGDEATEESTEEAPTAEATEEAETTDSELPPTLPIPSFTPAGSSSTFGDSGITPTTSFDEPAVPDALITPTAFAENNDPCIYVVQANDTLFSIATANEVTVDDFVAANPILAGNPNNLQIGQQLNIPFCESEDEEEEDVAAEETQDAEATADATQEASPPDDVSEGGRVHIIQEGDTLFRLALANNVTVQEIVAANPDIPSENAILQVGQEIIIPTPSE